MLAFLAQVPTAKLWPITYDIRATTFIDSVDEHALNALDETLFGLPYSRFGNLTQIRFNIPQTPVSGNLEDKFKKNLPRSYKRVALAVEVVETR